MIVRTRDAVAVIGSVTALFAVIVAFILLNPRLVQPREPAIGIETGQYAPSFTIRDVNMTEWDLAAHRGEVVLLDFMGVYCGPCMQEMRDGSMQSLYETYTSQGFTILSIDVGGISGTENPMEAWRFVRGLNSDGTQRWDPGNWPIALDNQGLATTFGVGPIPMKYLLDRSGKIAWNHVGYATPTEFRDQILPIL